MLSKLKKGNSQGFTIVEVLIVLAIAGLILLIVLLAVPALQRNAGNTNRKNDASAIAAAVSEYEDNNSGAAPGFIGTNANAGTWELCAAGDTGNCNAGTDSPAQFKVGHYSGKGTATGDMSFQAAGTAAAANKDTLYIEPGTLCNGNAPTTTDASPNDVAIVFNIADSGGWGEQCVDAT
jgi:prepilin-type N-terminal cleavage/methylation domain-containing protein